MAELPVHKATLGDEARGPQHEPYVHKPHTLKKHANRPHEANQETLGVTNAQNGSRQRYKDHGLEEPMVLPLNPHMIRGVEVENEELQPECPGPDHVG